MDGSLAAVRRLLLPEGSVARERLVSEPLITGFEVNTEEAVARCGEGCTFQLVVDCYGVQSKNQKSENVLEAEGWPA